MRDEQKDSPQVVELKELRKAYYDRVVKKDDCLALFAIDDAIRIVKKHEEKR